MCNFCGLLCTGPTYRLGAKYNQWSPWVLKYMDLPWEKGRLTILWLECEQSLVMHVNCVDG